MIIYIFTRLTLLFIISLVIFTALSIGNQYQCAYDLISLDDVMTHGIYYMAHAGLASIFLFYAVFLYRKGKPAFNKKLSDHFSLIPGLPALFIWFLGLLILGSTFYLQEVTLPKKYLPKTSFDQLALSDEMVKKSNERTLMALPKIIDEISFRRYSKAIELLDNNLQNSELRSFLYIVLTDLAKKKSKKPIRWTKKSKTHQKNGVKILLSLGDEGLKNKSCTKAEYMDYLKTLKNLYPTSPLINTKLKRNKLDLIFFGDAGTVKALYNKINLYIIDKKPQFKSNNRSYGLGEEILILISKIARYNNNIYFKDIIVLSNLKTALEPPPAYHIPYGRLENNHILVDKWENLVRDKRKRIPAIFVPDHQNGGVLELSGPLEIKQLVSLNKTINNASIVSIFDLIDLSNSGLNDKYRSPIFDVYLVEKISFYASTFILLLVFSFGGLIIRVRREKTPFWLIKVLLLPIVLLITFLAFYTIKELCFLILI
ncbi:MAG: hypothetical protein IEMM0008_0954 [bacterium]|nr:MAG: hypothetical protein IEMM0008_0954 [bacterium]